MSTTAPHGIIAESIEDGKATRARVVEMIEEGLDIPQIAEALGRSVDSITRSMRRWGFLDPVVQRMSDEMRALVLRLVEDGVPYTWIAETVGVRHFRHDSPWLREAKAVRASKGNRSNDWQQVWPAIRRDPQMLKIHHSIAPHNSSRGIRPES